MKIEMKYKVIWGSVATVLLGISFLLIRYTFFELHLMSQWTFILFLFGIVVVGVSTIVGEWKVMISTVVGYIVGFILGMVLFADVGVFDPNRGTYVYYGWLIWLLSFLVFIVIGVICFCAKVQNVMPKSRFGLVLCQF